MSGGGNQIAELAAVANPAAYFGTTAALGGAQGGAQGAFDGMIDPLMGQPTQTQTHTPNSPWPGYTPQPYIDPMTQIQKKYTTQGPDSSMAPMQAYQEYMSQRNK